MKPTVTEAQRLAADVLSATASLNGEIRAARRAGLTVKIDAIDSIGMDGRLPIVTVAVSVDPADLVAE